MYMSWCCIAFYFGLSSIESMPCQDKYEWVCSTLQYYIVIYDKVLYIQKKCLLLCFVAATAAVLLLAHIHVIFTRHHFISLCTWIDTAIFQSLLSHIHICTHLDTYSVRAMRVLLIQRWRCWISVVLFKQPIHFYPTLL